MATAANHVLAQNAASTTQAAAAKVGSQGTLASKITLLGSDGAKLEIQRNGVMIAKSSGGRKIVIKTTNAKVAAAKAAGGKAAMGKGAMGAAAMDKATMAKKVTIMGENGARLEIKRNGLMLAKSNGGREIKIASAKTKPTIMGMGKVSAAPQAQAGMAKAGMAKAGMAKAGMAKAGMAGGEVAKGGMTKAAMLKAAAAQAAMNPGREANVVAANGAKLELKRNGIIQMKTAAGKEIKIAANAKGKLAMLGGAKPGAVKAVAATKAVAPAAAAGAAVPPAHVLAPKHAIIAHKGGLVLVNPQIFVPGAAKAAGAATAATAAKSVVAGGAAAGSAAGLGVGLGAFGPILLVGAAAITGFGIYGYVTSRSRG